MADPDIVTDDGAILLSLGEEGVVAHRIGSVIFRAVAETMRGWPVHRVVRSAYPDLRSNGAELSDYRITHHAARPEIGVIPKFNIVQRGVSQDLAASANVRISYARRRMNDGLCEFRALDLCGRVHSSLRFCACLTGDDEEPVTWDGEAFRQ